MNKEANKIKRKSIGDYVFLLSVPATLLLLAFIMVDIFGRFLGFSLEYSLTLEELLLMVIGIASLAATWKAGLFINIDFLVVRFSERTRKILALGGILASLLCAAILMWFSYEATIRAFVGGARPASMNMPLGIWKAFVPVGFLILIVEMVSSLVTLFTELTEKSRNEVRKIGG